MGPEIKAKLELGALRSDPAGVDSAHAPNRIPHLGESHQHDPSGMLRRNENETGNGGEDQASDHAGQTLTASDRSLIAGILETAGIPAVSPLASVRGTVFLIHDTSVSISDAGIQNRANASVGPRGQGVSAWVPVSGDATISRPDFFNRKRPSTSEYEKASDIISQGRRESLSGDILNAAQPSLVTSTVKEALAGTGLPNETVEKIEAGVEAFKGGTRMGLEDGTKSTVAWAVELICMFENYRDYLSGFPGIGDAIPPAALAGKEEELGVACDQLADYFLTADTRIRNTVAVELIQVGHEGDNENTCDPDNPDMETFPNPPYSESQYQNLVSIYLRAALAAGRFPETVTHFSSDAFHQGHCDPRCFDLQKFYDAIARRVGHAAGSTYGAAPVYGRVYGVHNVWWHDRICHGPPPS